MILALPFLGRCSQLFVFHTRLVNGVLTIPWQLLTIEVGSRLHPQRCRFFDLDLPFLGRCSQIVCVPYSASECSNL